MNLLKILQKLASQTISFVADLLVPERDSLQRILKIDKSELRSLLPKSPTAIKDITVLFDYRNKIIKLLVKTLKYYNNLNVRKILASYLYEEMIEISSDISLFDGATPILVPMPMSKVEKSKKGFNQCEELCREIEKISGQNIKVSYDALKKIKETKRQTSLDREARLLNVQGSMIADGQIVKNQVVIVLDDVYTTLATFSEARRALLASHAKRVLGIFLAH